MAKKSVLELVDLCLQGSPALKTSNTDWIEVLRWAEWLQAEILRHRIGATSWSVKAPAGQILEVLLQDLESTKKAAQSLLERR